MQTGLPPVRLNAEKAVLLHRSGAASQMTRCAARFTCGIILSFLALGCATSPVPVAVTPEEQIRQDHGMGSHLARDFEPKLVIQKDIEVAVYLRKLADRLASTRPVLKDAPLGVFVIQDRDHKWKNFGIPGNRLYLSSRLLKHVETETELAAAVALEFAHILKRHVISRIGKAAPETRGAFRTIEYFGPAGIFNFSEAELLEATTEAVAILYDAGFDPRGLTELLRRHHENPGNSPWQEKTLNRLLENARQAIAMRAPLRNPVVKSKEFLTIRKRMQRL